MNHCSWSVTSSVLAQSPPPASPPVEPPPPSSSLLHAAATSESASTPAARNLSRFPLIWAPFPRGRCPDEPPCDPTSCPIALPRADAAGRGHPLERRGGEEERQTQKASPEDVRPGLRVVRQRDVAHDPAAEPVLQPAEVLG